MDRELRKLDLRVEPERITGRDSVFVTWDERWSLARYVDGYLEARGLIVDNDAREALLRCLVAFPPAALLRKSDLDFFLDANLDFDPRGALRKIKGPRRPFVFA